MSRFLLIASRFLAVVGIILVILLSLAPLTIVWTPPESTTPEGYYANFYESLALRTGISQGPMIDTFTTMMFLRLVCVIIACGLWPSRWTAMAVLLVAEAVTGLVIDWLWPMLQVRGRAEAVFCFWLVVALAVALFSQAAAALLIRRRPVLPPSHRQFQSVQQPL